jgi:nucleotide-binding universal stress UspA family protein
MALSAKQCFRVLISNRARYAELVILGQYEWQGSPENHPLPIAHSVVSRCGRPVLVVPAAVQLSALARIAIAWDGSREAVRSVHDALPLLRLARSVQVVTIIPPSAEDSEADAASLLAHLAKHRIEIGMDTLQIRTDDEHASLRKQIEQGHYDLLVMGGYSHPMWLEFIFGALVYVAFRLKPACISQAPRGFFAKHRRCRLGIQGQLRGEIGGHLIDAAWLVPWRHLRRCGHVYPVEPRARAYCQLDSELHPAPPCLAPVYMHQ